MDLFHNHVYNIVSFTEMMMEGQGHSVTDITFFKNLPDGRYHFGTSRIRYRTHNRRGFFIFKIIIDIGAFKDLFAGRL